MKRRITELIAVVLVLTMICSMTVSAADKDSNESPSPSSSASDNVVQESGGDSIFDVDESNIYSGMQMAYQDGYIPTVSNGKVTIVLPLITDKKIKNNKISVSVDLGDSSSCPFVYKNYKHNYYAQNNMINNGSGVCPSYLVAITLDLKNKRVNGSYPVSLNISGKDSDSNNFSQQFSIYTMITDGIDDQATPSPSPTPAETPEPNDKPFSIDTSHIYSGMGTSYSKGYRPVISNGAVDVILPIHSAIKLKNGEVRASADLGSTSASPFKFSNNEKVIKKEKGKNLYVIKFHLPLEKKRKNGSYPVDIKVQAMNENNQNVTQTFSVYITITDEIIKATPAPTKKPKEKPSFSPKVVVDRYEFDKKEITAGKEFSVKVYLKNTSKSLGIRNMTVSTACDNNGFELLDNSNVYYINSLARGGETSITLHYKTDCNIASNQYKLELSMNYASEKGSTESAQGSVFVRVKQALKVEGECKDFPQEAEAGDNVPYTVAVMNLSRSKIYNVRCNIKGDGFEEKATGFIGDMDPGSSQSSEMQVLVVPLPITDGQKESEQYGYANATITIKYEDQDGHEYKKETDVGLEITAPSAIKGGDSSNKGNGQWKITVGILAVVAIGAGVGTTIYIRRRRLIHES
ncbi:hypothetical protein lbkm_4173 [Lachnospiraceae bacterium KM106-2]|nr:hypothetical protein lbkm_4173 [Lachnospiraceae bacterium KM106-2]